MVFDTAFPQGGVELGRSNRYWELTAEHLYSDEVIIFDIIQAPAFLVQSDGTINLYHEDLSESGKIADYSDQLRDKLEPRYVKK